MSGPDAQASNANQAFGPLAEVLAAVASGNSAPAASSSSQLPLQPPSAPFYGPELDIDIIMETVAEDLQQSRPKDVAAQMSRSLLDYMNGESVDSSDSEPVDQPPVPTYDDFQSGMGLIHLSN